MLDQREPSKPCPSTRQICIELPASGCPGADATDLVDADGVRNPGGAPWGWLVAATYSTRSSLSTAVCRFLVGVATFEIDVGEHAVGAEPDVTLKTASALPKGWS